jgi:hypothetical protein
MGARMSARVTLGITKNCTTNITPGKTHELIKNYLNRPTLKNPFEAINMTAS